MIEEFAQRRHGWDGEQGSQGTGVLVVCCAPSRSVWECGSTMVPFASRLYEYIYIPTTETHADGRIDKPTAPSRPTARAAVRHAVALDAPECRLRTSRVGSRSIASSSHRRTASPCAARSQLRPRSHSSSSPPLPHPPSSSPSPRPAPCAAGMRARAPAATMSHAATTSSAAFPGRRSRAASSARWTAHMSTRRASRICRP